MDESYAIRRYEQAAALLPLRWQQQARQLPPRQMARAEELRLRAGGPMTVLLPEGEVVPGHSDLPPTVTQTDLEQLCDAVTDYSPVCRRGDPEPGLSHRPGRLPGGRVRHGGAAGGGQHQPAGHLVGDGAHRPGAAGPGG